MTEKFSNTEALEEIERMSDLMAAGESINPYEDINDWLYDFYPSYLPWTPKDFVEVVQELLDDHHPLLQRFNVCTGFDLEEDFRRAILETQEILNG